MLFSNSWILPLKVFFISTGVLSIALFCKTTVPFVMDFSVSRAAIIWTSFVSFLKPPYLYIVINGIIIIIAASSRWYQNDYVSSSTESTESLSPSPPTQLDVEYEMKLNSDFTNAVYEQDQMQMQRTVDDDAEEEEEEEGETKVPVFEDKSIVVRGDAAEVEVGYGDTATWNPPKRTDSLEILRDLDFSAEDDKPLVSTRIGHRKPVKVCPEGIFLFTFFFFKKV